MRAFFVLIFTMIVFPQISEASDPFECLSRASDGTTMRKTQDLMENEFESFRRQGPFESQVALDLSRACFLLQLRNYNGWVESMAEGEEKAAASDLRDRYVFRARMTAGLVGDYRPIHGGKRILIGLKSKSILAAQDEVEDMIDLAQGDNERISMAVEAVSTIASIFHGRNRYGLSPVKSVEDTKEKLAQIYEALAYSRAAVLETADTAFFNELVRHHNQAVFALAETKFWPENARVVVRVQAEPYLVRQ